MPTNSQIKKLIREVIAEGIDLDIPDAEIERVVDARLAAVTKRLDTLERTNVAAAKPDIVCTGAAIAKPDKRSAKRIAQIAATTRAVNKKLWGPIVPQFCEASPAAKPARLDVLRARQTVIAQRKAAK